MRSEKPRKSKGIQMLFRKIYFTFYCAATLLLTGCWGEEHGDLRQWVQTQKSEARSKIAQLMEPLDFKPQSYMASNLADPFNMLKLTQVLNKESAQNTSNISLLVEEQNRKKEELENYPIDSIVMVGSIKKDGKDTGLLRVNQLIYQVNTGHYIGQNYGKIISIKENNINLREVVQDNSGDWVERIATLDLQEGK